MAEKRAGRARDESSEAIDENGGSVMATGSAEHGSSTQQHGKAGNGGKPAGAATHTALRVIVEKLGNGEGEAAEAKTTRVDVRMPFELVRAGLRLGNLLPKSVRDKVSEALRDKGVPIGVTSETAEGIDRLAERLRDINIRVETEKVKVHIYAE